MMHRDPIAVLMCRTIETSFAGPMVAAQDGLPMSAKMFLVVMLAGQASMAHPASYEVERPAGAEHDCLKSFAAGFGGEVGEWRTQSHCESLIVRGSRQGFILGTESRQIPDFSNLGAFCSKKTRWEGV
jgi:hypothetical protein